MSASNPISREHPHVTPVRRYLWVLAALLTLLALSAGSALIKLGPFNTIINFVASVLSTLLLMTFLMHETEAHKLTRLTSALGFVWLSILIGLALADFLTRAPVPPPW